jgi:pimeloyl-ACP methyl ester carboxylesterase
MHGELHIAAGDGLMLFVRTDGVHGTAAPLVCLPGLTRNGRDFSTIAERYASGRFVVRPDFRGRGRSAYDLSAATYTPEAYATDVVCVLDALGIESAVLLGTSLGGSIATLVANLAPARVSGVILNDVGPKLESAGFARIQSYAGKLPSNATWADALAQVRSLAGDAASLIPDATWQRVLREQYREFGPGDIRPDHDPHIVAGMAAVDASQLGDTWPLFDGLAAIPTLVLRGARSDLFAADTVREMQHRKPDLVAVTVADRGHCPLLDEPESLAALDAFLR